MDVEKGKEMRTLFLEFLESEGIKYFLGIQGNEGWRDTDTLLRVEFYLKEKTISALFSPLAITCSVETSGLYAYDKEDHIDRWSSLKELCDHIKK